MSEFNNQMRLEIPDELAKPRFVRGSGISKEEAKEICEKHGVIWAVE